MSYKENVRDKMGASTVRSKERIDLWEEITAAYEREGVEKVEAELAEKMAALTDGFEDAIEKLQKML